jgi:hypothetical protein
MTPPILCARSVTPCDVWPAQWTPRGDMGAGDGTLEGARGSALDSMSDVTYPQVMRPPDKPLVWLHGVVKSPPLSDEGRLHAGVLLRRIQRGEVLPMPDSRPMPAIGPRCHELRLRDYEAE